MLTKTLAWKHTVVYGRRRNHVEMGADTLKLAQREHRVLSPHCKLSRRARQYASLINKTVKFSGGRWLRYR